MTLKSISIITLCDSFQMNSLHSVPRTKRGHKGAFIQINLKSFCLMLQAHVGKIILLL